MSTMYECDKVGPEWLASRKGWAFSARGEMPCSAERLFELMKTPEMWRAMLGLEVEWTSEFGPATSRTIKQGALEAHEQFFEWVEGERMAFRFDRASVRAFKAFAEEWIIHPAGESACVLEWNGAVSLRGAFALLSPLAKVGLTLNGQQGMAKLRKYVGSVVEADEIGTPAVSDE